MDTTTIIVIVVIVIISIFMSISFGYLILEQPALVSLDKEFQPIETPPKPYGPGYACTYDSDCRSGYVCDQVIRQCALSDGSPCENASQCLFSSYCSGTCISRSIDPNYVTGVAGDPCPCDDNSICVKIATNTNICRLLPGNPCTDDDQCVSRLCENGRCSNTLSIGSKCEYNSQCSTNNCSDGYCQYIGVKSGDKGAYCNITTGPQCRDEYSCSSSNICTDQSGNYLDQCGASFGCSDKYNCYATPVYDNGYQANLVDCGDPNIDPLKYTTYCQCLYPFNLTNPVVPAPNDTSDVGGCSSGFTASNGVCLYNTLMPCEDSNTCITGRCGSNGGIFRLDPQINTTIDPNYWSKYEDEDSGREYYERVYPVSGMYGMTNLKYTSLVNSSTMNIRKIFGYSYDYKYVAQVAPTFTEMVNQDYIYALVDNSIYKYNTILTPMNIILGSGLNGTLGTIYDVEAICFNSITVAIIMVADYNGKATFFMLTESGNTFIANKYTYQFPSSYQASSTIKISLAYIKQKSNLPWSGKLTILAVANELYISNNNNFVLYTLPSIIPSNGKTISKYHYETSILTYGLDGMLEQGIDLDTYFYIVLKVEYNDGSFQVIFSRPIYGSPRSINYQGTGYPIDMYSVNSNTYNVLNFSLCNMPPMEAGYQGMLLSSQATIPGTRSKTLPYLYYIINGVSYNITGYMGSRTYFLMTAGFLYIYSNQTCD